ncbi:MAG: transcriptional crp fnr family protein [Paenibacillus sp.]|nr:transcriptional crp fnr family protein [Paenibacillus sp.]
MKQSSDEYDALKAYLRIEGDNDSDWDWFRSRTKRMQINPNSYLIRSGELVEYAYFFRAGLFRLFYLLEDGKEYTKSFSIGPDFVTSYAAMISGTPSAIWVQAMEEAVVIEIPYALLEELASRHHSWERAMRKSVEQLYLKKEERERQLLYLSAEERLQAFREQYPGLDGRIPQYLVASYLGINPVSLSRIVGRIP